MGCTSSKNQQVPPKNVIPTTPPDEIRHLKEEVHESNERKDEKDHGINHDNSKVTTNSGVEESINQPVKPPCANSAFSYLIYGEGALGIKKSAILYVLHHETVDTFIALKPKTVSMREDIEPVVIYTIFIPSLMLKDSTPMKIDQVSAQFVSL